MLQYTEAAWDMETIKVILFNFSINSEDPLHTVTKHDIIVYIVIDNIK